ncbi:MAG: M1 family metallopeptidase [Proteobacteria bacterium]|nr:M1 family metallopeptidase [Pseudomonadota bacterium]
MALACAWFAAAGVAFAASAAPRTAANRVILPDTVAPVAYRIDITPDAAALAFTGTVEIDIVARAATRTVTLNSLDLVIERATADALATPAAVGYDVRRQRATLTFAHPLAAGRHTLRLAYRGRIADSPSGFFHLDYRGEHGDARALYTKFENSDARRFVPCWDEPARKAVFTLATTVPAAQMPVSNMPVAATETLADGRKHVRFAPTPPMSTYLLFLAVGDFERVHRDVGGVDVGVVVRRGQAPAAAYALDTLATVLPYYNDYFGTPYPLPKLDIVGGPGGSQRYAAMENWGAIFVFEQSLLVDPRISSERDRQDVFTVLTHEVAHQWFGNLVTMAWWDDLWLNEGFATWIETKVAAHFHPDWYPWLDSLSWLQWTMTVDARRGTHPVVTPIDDVLAADGAFDTITYGKGAAVIRMIEAYVGAQAFRDGVRRYIDAHRYGNTVSDDFWRALDAVLPQPILPLAHDFTLQAGVPLVSELSLRCANGHSVVGLAQGRFAVDAEAGGARMWRVPVTVATPDAQPATAIVRGQRATPVTTAGCGPLVINAGHTGYYRVRYGDGNFAAIVARYAALAPEDQLGILGDTFALAYNGNMAMGPLVALLRAVPADVNPAVASYLTYQMKALDSLYTGLPGQAAFRAYARTVMAPVLARIGWDAAPGEGDAIATLRSEVIETLAALDDATVVAEARRRFDAFRAQPATLPASLREPVFSTVAMHADAATWDAMHALARAAGNDVERRDYYVYLAQARDAGLADRALALAVSGEPPTGTAPQMLRRVADQHPDRAFAFVVLRWDQVAPHLEPGSRERFVARLASQGRDLAMIPKLEAYARDHVPAGARQDVTKAEAAIRYAADIRRTRLPELDRAVAEVR